jgi:hypothetical protein
LIALDIIGSDVVDELVAGAGRPNRHGLQKGGRE